jgi:hypothetical protein
VLARRRIGDELAATGQQQHAGLLSCCSDYECDAVLMFYDYDSVVMV